MMLVLLGASPIAAPAETELRIDNSSTESFRASWQHLYESLSATQQRNLENAVILLALAPYRGKAPAPKNLKDGAFVSEMIRSQIAGMTYEEIIELSQKSAGSRG
jgi:hypothetical protein